MAALAACSNEPPAPSCQQAVDHYYGAGCTFVDLATDMPRRQDAALDECQRAVDEALDDCDDEVGDWLRCIDETSLPDPCDCSQEETAMYRCSNYRLRGHTHLDAVDEEHAAPPITRSEVCAISSR
jgi:hypothetical protein